MIIIMMDELRNSGQKLNSNIVGTTRWCRGQSTWKPLIEYLDPMTIMGSICSESSNVETQFQSIVLVSWPVMLIDCCTASRKSERAPKLLSCQLPRPILNVGTRIRFWPFSKISLATESKFTVMIISILKHACDGGRLCSACASHWIRLKEHLIPL